MSKPLDHILITRGAQEWLFEKRGANGQDLKLLRGLPEPRSNFSDDLPDRLIETRRAVACTCDGKLEDGTRHPSFRHDLYAELVVAPNATAAEAQAESGDSAPNSEEPAPESSEVLPDSPTEPASRKTRKP